MIQLIFSLENPGFNAGKVEVIKRDHFMESARVRVLFTLRSLVRFPIRVLTLTFPAWKQILVSFPYSFLVEIVERNC